MSVYRAAAAGARLLHLGPDDAGGAGPGAGRGVRERWDYVVVDEAQDLPPAALALAVELCATIRAVSS